MKTTSLPSGERLERALSGLGDVGSWARCVGTVTNVALRPFPGEPPRTLEGTWAIASLDAVFGPHACSVHVVLSRQGAWGPEVCAGELVTAEIVRAHAVVWNARESAAGSITSSDDLREDSGGWADAISASSTNEPARGKSPTRERPTIPERSRPRAHADDEVFPEARDRVEHFHFGPAEVLKSDGERLHVKVARDGRIKELVLAMLKVTLLSDDGGVRSFKLDRKF